MLAQYQKIDLNFSTIFVNIKTVFLHLILCNKKSVQLGLYQYRPCLLNIFQNFLFQDKYFVKLDKGILGADCPLADGCVCKKSWYTLFIKVNSYQFLVNGWWCPAQHFLVKFNNLWYMQQLKIWLSTKQKLCNIFSGNFHKHFK